MTKNQLLSISVRRAPEGPTKVKSSLKVVAVAVTKTRKVPTVLTMTRRRNLPKRRPNRNLLMPKVILTRNRPQKSLDLIVTKPFFKDSIYLGIRICKAYFFSLWTKYTKRQKILNAIGVMAVLNATMKFFFTLLKSNASRVIQGGMQWLQLKKQR